MTEEEKQQAQALIEIAEERTYQRKRWSIEQDRLKTPERWIGVLAISLGKISQEAEAYRNGHAFQKRVAQLAAVCAAVLEATDPGFD